MDISKLKQKCSAGGFRPDKRLGQNFLIDNNIRNKILGLLPINKDTTVLEIGPGFGMMTDGLAGMSKAVYAVEKDRKLYQSMEETFGERSDIHLILSDILDVDIEGIGEKAGGELFVYGNIPYNITAPILEKAIESRSVVTALYMVIQDEVALRLCASPGTKTYGKMTCFAGYYAEVRRFFKISRNCFFPKPKVDSALIGIEFFKKPKVEVEDKDAMFRIIHKAFSERRKKILNPLSSSGFMGFDRKSWAEIFEAAGVDASLRAEDISLSEYARISDEAGKACSEC